MDARITLLPEQSSGAVNVVITVSFRTVGEAWTAPARFYGILCEPKKPGKISGRAPKFPARVCVHIRATRISRRAARSCWRSAFTASGESRSGGLRHELLASALKDSAIGFLTDSMIASVTIITA
ncbi:MAG: hypothetical protein QM760_10220 [Nibricoccus sp.]